MTVTLILGEKESEFKVQGQPQVQETTFDLKKKKEGKKEGRKGFSTFNLRNKTEINQYNPWFLTKKKENKI